MTITQRDRFGIKKIYLTSAYGFNGTGGRNVGGKGWEYHSIPWNQNKIYEHTPETAANGLLPEQLTDVTMHYSKTRKSFVKIHGNGGARFHLPEPNKEFRLSLFDENNLYYGIENALSSYGRRWTSNVEFTFYFNIGSYDIGNTATHKRGSMQIGLCSDHHFLDSPLTNNNTAKFCPFNSHEYNLVITYDGHMYFTSEIYHGAGYSLPPKPTDIFDVDFFDSKFTSIPLETSYGIKFIKRVINSKNVLLEAYMDNSDGFDGGSWKKLFEFKHERNNWTYPNTDNEVLWEISNSNKQYSVTKQVPKVYDDPVADGGGGLCYLKLDPINEIDLKWISCRDIEPEGLSPNTDSSDLTTNSELYGENPADNL